VQPPNIENLFMAGGIAFFFDPGTGEKDLGLMEDPPEVEPKTTEVKVYSSRSGKRRLAKTFATEEEVIWNMKLQELVASSMQAFFKGGPLEVVNPGTGNVTDQLLTLSGATLASVNKYGLTNVTVRQFLDKCLVYSGGAYVDRSAEADTLAGTAFSLLANAADYAYFGKLTKFKEVYLDLNTLGSYTGVSWEYWNGATWSALVTNGAGKNLDAEGKVNFTPPADWAASAVNASDSLFWIRVKCTAVTTPATCACVRQNAVLNADYILDPGQVAPNMLVGRIGRLAGGFLNDGEEVKVSYTHETWGSIRFPVAADNYQTGTARLQFQPLKGFRWNYIVPKCQLKPGGKLTFDDKKTMELPMILEVLDGSETSPNAPYGYWECLNES
jgi:hypothetical protein